MALLIKASGQIRKVHPPEGGTFTLTDIKLLIGGIPEQHMLPQGRLESSYTWIWMNPQAQAQGPVNVLASNLAGLPLERAILGDVLLTSDEEVSR
jgi:hypothetical protein